MKLYDAGGTLILVLAVAALIGYASSKFLGDDNIVEESMEAVIEHNTGYDVDLTSSSKEDSFKH